MITYSLYDAKAKFSEIIRQVREGKSITVSYRGEAVAVIRPVPKSDKSLARRIDRLESNGVVSRSGGHQGRLRTTTRKPGALTRFLAERD
jgi:prevent-host-death family protein